MTTNQGHILVVDDNKINRMLLTRALQEQGYSVATAEDGLEALAALQVGAPAIDGVLLDILMPELDGYETLVRIKTDAALRHIPVIMISAVDELDSVIRCIETGATDYLPKPFNPALLRARLTASLATKRLRDLELEYLEQVGRVTAAATAVAAATFAPETLAEVAARPDALGNLARIFQRMAIEVHAREQRLKQQLQQLQLDLEERQKAAAETVPIYLPMDRRHALARGETLPEWTHGAALFADISGFTPLTEALAQELGLQRGAEELTRQLNRVYGALIDEVHRYAGSVISFSGDAITCWFDESVVLGPLSFASTETADMPHKGQRATDNGQRTALRATACALAMQAAMGQFATITTPIGTTIALAIKVAVVAGPARRLLVGDVQIQNIEVLAGRTLDELAVAEHQAQRGEVVVQEAIVAATGARLSVAHWRADAASGARFAVVTGLTEAVAPAPWPDLPADRLTAAQARPWLLPPVYERVHGGKSAFLSELRPAAALFLMFHGIDYDGDQQAGAKLDAFVRRVQTVLARYDGALLQLTMGDKGSYLYGAFGAPISHDDDAVRAVAAALDLQALPAELPFISALRIGVAYGQMRAGAYGGTAHRTYGVLGDKTNLAARLMQIAADGILCDDAIYQAARSRLRFDALPPIAVKGKAQPVAIYRPAPATAQSAIASSIDQLPSAHQLLLKVASVIGRTFAIGLLRDIYPIVADTSHLEEHLQALELLGLVTRKLSEPELNYAFDNSLIQELAYNRLLFAQRRQLHRAVAEWYERTYADNLEPCYLLLVEHWNKAEDAAKTIHYLERAGEHARQQGDYHGAAQYFRQSLALDAQAAVLSDTYPTPDLANEAPPLEEER